LWFGKQRKNENMPFLKINRFGRVTASKSSKNQCKAVGYKEYDYQVSVTCPSQNLDKNEQVIDHNVIHAAVVKFFAEKMTSCEGLEVGLAKAIYNLVKAHGTFATDLYIKIMPVAPADPNHAYMEYSLSGNF
jgi:hypothetical protein